MGETPALSNIPDPIMVDDGMIGTDPVVPCPFCSEGLHFSVHLDLVQDPETGAGMSAISCSFCGAEGPIVVGQEAEALAAWNSRRRGLQ
jgi:hypothetical protein